MDGWNTSFLLGWPIFRGFLLLVLRRVKQPIWHGSISSPQPMTHRGENGGKTPWDGGPLIINPQKKVGMYWVESHPSSPFSRAPKRGGQNNEWIFSPSQGYRPTGLIPMNVSLWGCPTQLCFHLTRCAKLIYQLSQHLAVFAQPLGQVPETCRGWVDDDVL